MEYEDLVICKFTFSEDDTVDPPDLSFVGQPGPLDGKTYVFDHSSMGGADEAYAGSKFIFEGGKMTEIMAGIETTRYYQCKDGVIYEYEMDIGFSVDGLTVSSKVKVKMEVSDDLGTLTLSTIQTSVVAGVPEEVTIAIDIYYTLQD